jgi:hypothetical protein
MLLDPARGFCLAVEVTKEARVVIRPGYTDAPTVAALNRFQFGHLKVLRRGNVFRPPTLRLFCVPSDHLLDGPLLWRRSAMQHFTLGIAYISNKQQTKIKQITNKDAVLNVASRNWEPIAWGVRHE